MKTCVKLILKSVACISFAVAALVACEEEIKPDGDDTGNEGGTEQPVTPEEPTELMDSLENALYRQARAMQLILTGEDVLVSSCAHAQEGIENLYDITLTTGAAFTMFSDENGEFASALSYLDEDGVKYWALTDKDGKVSAVLDAEGKKIAMDASVDVKLVDKKYTLRLNDASYDMGYGMEDPLQMFGCKPFFDDEGAAYAVEFDFGEGKTHLVYVSDYPGVYFYLPSDESKTALTEVYVNQAGVASVAVASPSVLEWKPVVSEGWTVSVREDGGVSYVDIKATDKADYQTEPVLSIVSEDESYTFSSIALTDEMFHTFAVSVTDAVVVPASGLGRFAYGLSVISDFDEQKMLSLAEGLIAGTASPSDGCGVSDTGISKAFADILGTSLDAEERYVLWAVADGMLVQLEFGEIAVDIDIVKTSLLDAEVAVKVNGASSVFGGLIEKSDDAVNTIVYQVSNLIYEPITVGEKFEYQGSAADFPVVDTEKDVLMPATTYILWVVPAVDGEYVYTEKDVIMKEFTTNDVTSGGTLELTCGEAEVTTSTITIPLSCEGAEMIYYAYLKADGGKRYSSDQVPDHTKFEQIVTEDSDFRVGDYVAVIGDRTEAVGKNFNDEAATEYYLFAVAVDSEGRYGKVKCISAKTEKLEYDKTISLKVENLDVTAKKIQLKVTSTGGDLSEYIYWAGRVTDPFWANTAYCGKTSFTAQKYMALNPEDENIRKAMNTYGPLNADGTITLSGLTMETEYVFVILEKGEKYYSKIGYIKVTTLAADLGEIVREGTDKWNAAKSRIRFDWHKDAFEQPPHLMATYSFDITCPTEFTTYVMCASEDYFDAMGLIKVEHDMIELESFASRRVDKDRTVYDESGNMLTEPDYYKEGVLKDGQLMSVNDFYVHGVPREGTVTYFAKDTHAEQGCPTWNGTSCDNYVRAQEKLEYYRSLEPWEIRASTFGLKGKEAEDWAKALQESYSRFYADAKPLLYVNDGSPLRMTNPYGTGVNEDGVVPDRVIVMLKDLQGNYYEPMYFEVPNYFEETEE